MRSFGSAETLTYQQLKEQRGGYFPENFEYEIKRKQGDIQLLETFINPDHSQLAYLRSLRSEIQMLSALKSELFPVR